MEKKFRITFVINNLTGGGAERVLVNVLNNLDREKFIPSLFLFEYEGKYINDLSSDIRVGYSRRYKDGNKGKDVFKYIRRYTIGLRKLKKFVKNEDITVGFLENLTTYIVGEIAKKSSKDYYAWIHNNLSNSSKIHKILSKKYYKYYKKVFCVSKECENLAIAQYPILENKIKTIYNPMEIDMILNKAKLNGDIELPEGKNIVAIGRLTYQKGFDTLIKAFSIVNDKESKLTIIGEGEERKKLEKLVVDLGLEKRVFLPGFTNNPYTVLDKADLFVLSSRYEGLPTVLIEALALNKKIVSTRCSGSDELLDGGKFGILSNIDNEKELAMSIDKALASKCLINGYEKAMEFDKSNIITQLENELINTFINS